MIDIKELVLSEEALGVIDKGTWVTDIEGYEGIELLVTGFDRNEKVQRELRRKQGALQKKQRNRELSDTQRAAVVREVLADHVLLDWKGISSDGKPLKYDKAQAKKWLTSRRGETFAVLVLEAARQVDERANEFVEDVTKN